MEIVLQWLLLTVAVAAGWVVGRFGSQGKRRSRAISDEDSVRDRLQFLFTNYSDQAVDNFVQSLAVNKDTVSLHLSIGSHFRNKGETDRAILIHQNLLARPELPARSPINSACRASTWGKTCSANRSNRLPAADSFKGFERRTNSSTPA